MTGCSPRPTASSPDPGYWLAGYLVEVLSGKAYADAMDARLFQPLGMQHTTLRPLLAMTWPLAQGHAAAGRLPRRPSTWRRSCSCPSWSGRQRPRAQTPFAAACPSGYSHKRGEP